MHVTYPDPILRPQPLPPSDPAKSTLVVTRDSALPRHLQGAVILLGNFDGFHRGHQALLTLAKQVAAIGAPLALMSCEPHPKTYFGADPHGFRLTTPRSKRALLRDYGFDYVYSPHFDADFANQSPDAFVYECLIRDLGVSHVITGEDFRFGAGRAGDVALLGRIGRKSGFDTHTVAEVGHTGARCSSTRIRARIAAGDMAGAANLLGQGWLAEVIATPGGGHRLHPDLLHPPAGRYLAQLNGADRATMIGIGPDGSVWLPRPPETIPAGGNQLIRFLSQIS